ncbi:MAG: uroporphyrinogen-III synthase [Flavobacteriia bacterium]|nr:uroporphyrinogen-III synthase [Flavobacteriia bacterium]
MFQKLFISKPITEVQELNDFCQKKHLKLIAHSFLSFEPIPFIIPSNSDVFFFGSKRSVDFFLTQAVIPSHIKIACVGEGTANYIISKGYHPTFIGEKSGEIENVAINFKQWLGTRSVVFIQAKDSNRSVSKQINIKQSTELIVYKTILTPTKIEPCNSYVFTSPSNVDGFLVENNIPPNSKIIAWGNTTENHLINHGFTVYFKLKNSSIAELIPFLSNQ